MFEEMIEGAAVAERAAASVVRVGRDQRGSGIVVAEGIVLTSAHNLRGGELTVHFPDGRVDVGVVKGVDVDGDLAAVAVGTRVGALGWPDNGDQAPVLGQPVFVTGITRRGAPRVTWGVVSSLGASFRGPQGCLIDDAFEHTAPVAPGGSGGPVLDAAGRVIGINTHRPGGGFYLARPATHGLVERVASLARGESPSRRRIGVLLVPPHVARRLRSAVGLTERDGVLVRDVDQAGPGAAAGLRQGDLIAAAAGRPVTSIDDLLNAAESVEPGSRLVLLVVRGNDEMTVEIDLSAAAN